MNLTIDIGNTKAKVGVFQDNVLVEVTIYPKENFHAGFKSDLEKYLSLGEIKYIGLACVGKASAIHTMDFLEKDCGLPKVLHITHETSIPVINAYETPTTLGIDRIVAVVGAFEKVGEGPVLVIDAGTAVTYEFADEQRRYLGGGIAPGMYLRFKSLNDYTAKLPLLNFSEDFELLGRNTEKSILSGVQVGFIAEVDGIIDRYRGQYGEDLKVLLTGGDGPFLGNHIKNINFVDSNLLLEGINAIIIHNHPQG